MAPRPVGTGLHQCDRTSFNQAVFGHVSQSGTSEAVASIQPHWHLQGLTLSKPHLISIYVLYREQKLHGRTTVVECSLPYSQTNEPT